MSKFTILYYDNIKLNLNIVISKEIKEYDIRSDSRAACDGKDFGMFEILDISEDKILELINTLLMREVLITQENKNPIFRTESSGIRSIYWGPSMNYITWRLRHCMGLQEWRKNYEKKYNIWDSEYVKQYNKTDLKILDIGNIPFYLKNKTVKSARSCKF